MADGGWDLRAFRRVGTDAEQQTTIGWFRDPIRHHDERYRDEDGWAPPVAAGGRTSLPEAAAAPSRSWSLHPTGLALTLGVLVSVLLLVYVVFASSTGGPAA